MPVKFDQLMVNNYLDRAVAEFNTNPLSARLIRRMANELPDLFVTATLRYLDSEDHSAAHQFLTSLMLRQQSVFEEVADPARGPLPRSINLFTRLWKVDGCFDIKLARRLPDRAGHNHAQAFDRGRCCRTLDVLNEVSVGRRLIPIVGHLVESLDRVIAAKATLFVGRRMQNPEWTARQITRENPEDVRANAVESLWGLNSKSAQELLENCVMDESVRVSGNALVGLHKLGKPGILEKIAEMVTAETPDFRTKAAWTMGKIGHSAFADPLTGLLKDESAEVRSVALQSLLQLRRAEAASREEAAKNPPVAQPVEAAVRGKPAAPPAPRVIEETAPADIDIRLDGSRHSTRSDRLQ